MFKYFRWKVFILHWHVVSFHFCTTRCWVCSLLPVTSVNSLTLLHHAGCWFVLSALKVHLLIILNLLRKILIIHLHTYITVELVSNKHWIKWTTLLCLLQTTVIFLPVVTYCSTDEGCLVSARPSLWTTCPFYILFIFASLKRRYT